MGPAVITHAGAFATGLRAGYSVAAFVLFATALGFGALARGELVRGPRLDLDQRG